MSATPPANLSGRTPTNPPLNGVGPRPPRRKPPPADPLVRPRSKLAPRPRPTQVAPRPATNGLPPPERQDGSTSIGINSRSPSAQPPIRTADRDLPLEGDDTLSGFSDPNVVQFDEFPLKISKSALLDGLRFHVARFPSGKSVDPRDEAEFPRPVRLHRRDPRAPPPGSEKNAKNAGDAEGDNTKDSAEKEELDKRKEERQKEREANLAQIAPSAETGQKRSNVPRKKTQQVFRSEFSAKDSERLRTQYEEKLPWHMEDFDNKNPFVGSLEAKSSRIYAALVIEGQETGQAAFRLLPLEKYYKFNPKQTRQALTIEEVEKAMKKRSKDPDFLVKRKEAILDKKRQDFQSRQNRGLFSLKDSRAAGEDLGMEFDEDFADDEEGVHFVEKDDDTKFAEDRIKKDQLKANIFAMKEEKEFDEEEEQERRQKEQLQRLGKGVTKLLKKKEKNFDLFSDSDENPYASESDSDDSETERLKEEQKRVDEEKQRKDKEGKDGDKSGASTKGTTTPSGRKEKHGDLLKKSTSSKNLKRPGSPNLSDASGTDSSRKKPKKKHGLSSSQPTGTSTPQPGSRPTSPPPSSAPLAGQRTTSLGVPQKKRPRPAGAGSDSEGAAFSDTAASDGGVKPKRIKINGPGVKSPTALSPQGSRAVSPAPAVPTARAASPNGMPSAGLFPTIQDIAKVIPKEGIATGDLIKTFRARIGGDNSAFIALVKKAGHFDKATKLIRPKAA